MSLTLLKKVFIVITLAFALLCGIFIIFLVRTSSDKLYTAISKGDVKTVQAALEADRNLWERGARKILVIDQSPENITHLEFACATSKEMADLFLQEEFLSVKSLDSSYGSTALIYALSADYPERFEVARTLIDRGVDINVVDDRKRTALNLALITYSTDSKEVKKESREILEYLLHDCDLNDVIKKSGDSPLNVAIKMGDVDTLKYLLQTGNIDVNTIAGNHTALMRAVQKGDFSMCELLIRHGALVNIQSPLGLTARDYAKNIRDRGILQLLSGH